MRARASGRSGIASSRRRSNTAGYACTTPLPRRQLGEGRFFAIPARRGKPGGVGPIFRSTSETRHRPPPAAPPSAGRRRPPARVRGLAYPEDRSTALARRAGGRAPRRRAAWRAPSRARRRSRSVGCSSARPQTTSTFGSSRAIARRKSHLRRSASSSVNERSGSATASGIPGEPPPSPRRRSAPAFVRSAARAEGVVEQHAPGFGGSRSPVSPGVDEHALEPALEELRRVIVSRRCCGGARRRSGSARSLRSASRPRDRP